MAATFCGRGAVTPRIGQPGATGGRAVGFSSSVQLIVAAPAGGVDVRPSRKALRRPARAWQRRGARSTWIYHPGGGACADRLWTLTSAAVTRHLNHCGPTRASLPASTQIAGVPEATAG